MNDWECPYCHKVAREGENKLRHLAKHETAIGRLLKENFILRLRILPEIKGV